jgi:Calcineurin-like phosphoesterase
VSKIRRLVLLGALKARLKISQGNIMPRPVNAPLPNPIFHEPVFNEADKTPSPNGFATHHPSDTALYKELGNLLKTETTSFDQARGKPQDVFGLAAAYGANGPAVVKKIQDAKRIVFHAAGDTGASSEGKFKNEIRVADRLTADCQSSPENDRPAFLFHLGDVVYDFGEKEYYYDQFYEPFRNYPAPIFAIPGNHDSFVVPDRAALEHPLATFSRQFCAEELVVTPEARSLHRTAMTQPGVYFTLDAPFVRIIGLFSNALEDPGVISGKGPNKGWPGVPNFQLDYLAAQFKQLKDEKYKGAVLLAVHHPPFSYSPQPKRRNMKGAGGNHGSSSDMLRQIDTICKDAGIYPHAVLSAHAHNYQRYTRTITFGGKEYQVPFLVCGDSGHNVNPLVRPKHGESVVDPNPDTDVSYLEVRPAVPSRGVILKKCEDHNYGYLRVSVDKDKVAIAFYQAGTTSMAQSRYDLVTVNLEDHRIVGN